MNRTSFLLALGLAACSSGPTAGDVDGGAPAPRPSEEVAAAPPVAPSLLAPPSIRAPVAAAAATVRERVSARAGDQLRIEAGTLHVGSQPGTRHRRPSVEADLVEVAMPAVDIDRLPYPNDPSQPITLAGTRAEAASLCEARGRRLCHELEWERACRGDSTDRFPTGAALDLEACSQEPASCGSETGALSMGIEHAEWTASDAEERLARLERTAVVRGAFRTADDHRHACGARHVRNPAGGGRALAFRCCGGEAPQLAYPDVGLRRIYEDLDWDADRYREVLATIPELASFADGFVPYGETAALRALGRGGAGVDDIQWELVRAPFAWSPSPGEEVYVFAGASGERSMIAVIYPLADGSFRHAASFLFEDEAAPIALMRTQNERSELLWSTCWGCMGESGVVRFDEDATIVIAQQ